MRHLIIALLATILLTACAGGGGTTMKKGPYELHVHNHRDGRVYVHLELLVDAATLAEHQAEVTATPDVDVEAKVPLPIP